MIAFMPLRLCKYCIAELESRGEKIIVDSETKKTKCEWCGETDETHEVLISN